MGSANCFTENSDRANMIDNLDTSRAFKLTHRIKNNLKFMRQIKKLQLFMKILFAQKKYGFLKKGSVVNEEKKSNYLDIMITKTIDNSLLILNSKYKPLLENISLIGRKCVQYEDKSIYYGEWNSKFNQKHGRGILQLSNGTKYEGYFKYDKANIYGQIIFANGESYEGKYSYNEGEFFNGKYNGYGTYLSINGEKYSGQFRNNNKEGQGIEYYIDGSCYIGEFFDGAKHGSGKIKYPDKDEYEGKFCMNTMNGKGIYTWFCDNTQFLAEWKDNKLKGEGVFKWRSDKKFVGNYVEDINNDIGAFEWDFGVKYKFSWENGNPNHKRGEFYNPETKLWCKANEEKPVEKVKEKPVEKEKSIEKDQKEKSPIKDDQTDKSRLRRVNKLMHEIKTVSQKNSNKIAVKFSQKTISPSSKLVTAESTNRNANKKEYSSSITLNYKSK